MADEPNEPGQPDKYEALFHELRNSDPRSRKSLSTQGVFGVAIGLVIGFAAIIGAVIALGNNNADGFDPGPAIYVCDGEPATITGTDGDDVIMGTTGRDVIHARLGDDVVEASGGNDIVCGGKGDDELNGGRGNDTILGGDGKDTCNGDAGDDTFKDCETESQ